jgi:putative nucleotidyltransferase with HDIG domain
VKPSVAINVTRLGRAVDVVSSAASHGELLDSLATELNVLLDGTASAVSRVEGNLLHEVAGYWPDEIPPERRFADYGYLLDDYPATKASLESRRPYAMSLADEVVEPTEAFVLRELGMAAVLVVPIVVSNRPWGVAEVYDAGPRRFDDHETALADIFVRHVAALVAQFDHAAAVERVYRETLASLANALEEKDAYTHDHTNRVVELARAVANDLGVDQDYLRAVELGALLHDIGKIRVPESILNKSGPLDPEEWAVIRRHTIAGESILRPIADLRNVLPIVRSSHERWDGRGYPDQLERDSIPLGARIISVCDAYRAMIEPRPYRPARLREEARRELENHAGTQFDRTCVEALLRVLARHEAEERELRLHRPPAAA